MGKKTQRKKKEKDINFEVIVFAFYCSSFENWNCSAGFDQYESASDGNWLWIFFYMG